MTAQIPLTGSVGPTGPFAILGFSLPVITGNADHVLTVAEYSSTSLKVTSDGASLAIRKVVAPLAPGFFFVVENLTSEGFAITLGGASGTAVTVPSGATVLATCVDGANYVAIGGGGGIIVANAAGLTAVPASGLVSGTTAVVQTFGALFTLSAAGPTVDGVTVIAASDGRIWQRGPSLIVEAALAQTTWVIDPAAGSDEATGLTLVAALKTGNEVIRRWGTATPKLTVAVTIKWNSSAPATDAFVVNPICTNAGSLLLTNNGLTVALTTTIAAFTARNLATGALDKITATGVASWASFVGALVHDTTAGATFFIDRDAGGGVAEITAPLQTSSMLSLFGPSNQAIANTDSITIFAALPVVYLPATDSQTIPGVTPGLMIQALQPRADIISRIGRALYAECRFGVAGDVLAANGAPPNFQNPIFNGCRFDANGGNSCFQGGGSLIGGSVQGVGAQYQGTLFIDGNLIQRQRFHPTHCYMLIGSIWMGEGPENSNGASQYVAQASSYTPDGNPRVWGIGPMNVQQGTRYRQVNGTAAGTLLVTAGLQIDAAATGFTFNKVTGTYSPGPVALTPAAVDTNGSMTNPFSQSGFSIGTND